jgi:putative transposase
MAVIEAHLKDNPVHGFGLLFDQALTPAGFGKIRSWRVYVSLKLNLPSRGKRRLPKRVREPLEVPVQCNHTWPADFMADALWSGDGFAPSTSTTISTANRYVSKSIPACHHNASFGR